MSPGHHLTCRDVWLVAALQGTHTQSLTHPHPHRLAPRTHRCFRVRKYTEKIYISKKDTMTYTHTQTNTMAERHTVSPQMTRGHAERLRDNVIFSHTEETYGPWLQAEGSPSSFVIRDAAWEGGWGCSRIHPCLCSDSGVLGSGTYQDAPGASTWGPRGSCLW